LHWPAETAAAHAPSGTHPARCFCLAFCMLFGLIGQLQSQFIDARLIPPGTLRVAFSPQYQSWDHMFAEDGSVIPLGKYLSADSAGSNLFPTLAGAEAAVRSIIGDQAYRLSLGSMTTRLDADVRRFPFEFSLGLARRLTLTATVPIVVTRVNAAIALDSISANAGWNQAVFESQNAVGLSQITILLAQLGRGATALQSQISSGSSPCPDGIAQAQSLLVRTNNLRADLASLTGVSLPGTSAPPATPLASSPAGAYIAAYIGGIFAELQSCVTGVTPATLPLPTRRLPGSDVQKIFSGSSFGYDAALPAYSKRPHFGDVELGARLGLTQSPKTRLVVFGTARLPTGSLDSPDNLVDIGTGDRQTSFVAGFEAAAEAGRASLTAAGSFTLRLPGEIVRRVTAPTQPIAPASTTATLTRDLGDVVWFSAYPALHLSDAFRLYGSVSYYRKGADHYESASGPASPSPALLEQQTAMRSMSVGGGIAYRVAARSTGLPIDAGVSYQMAVSGSGGFTPKATVLTIYLRTYYRIWKGAGD
jgi:hypothetical protein